MQLFFFNDTATTEIYTLSLHDALPILVFDPVMVATSGSVLADEATIGAFDRLMRLASVVTPNLPELDRKSTRLNSSHANISYAVFCLKKNDSSPGRRTSPILCLPEQE